MRGPRVSGIRKREVRAMNRTAGDATRVRRLCRFLFACLGASVVLTTTALAPGSQAHPGDGGWRIVRSLSATAGLFGVSCPSADACWAVGIRTTRSGSAATLIERHTEGTWAQVPSPNEGFDDYLLGVACSTDDDCWAVGYYVENNSGAPWETLTEHYTDGRWRIVPSPSVDVYDWLSGVTCVGLADCWGVGFHTSNHGPQTLIEHYSGGRWSVVASPNTSAGGELTGVACATATSCWAVGTGTLIAHFDGRSWSLVSGSASGEKRLNAVACSKDDDCFAVGSSLARATLVEANSGAGWAAISSQDVPHYQNQLYGVACARSKLCWGVGYYSNPGAKDSGPYLLVERSTDSGWIVTKAPQPPSTSDLLGVACPSHEECYAVGSVIEQWTSGDRGG